MNKVGKLAKCNCTPMHVQNHCNSFNICYQIADYLDGIELKSMMALTNSWNKASIKCSENNYIIT